MKPRWMMTDDEKRLEIRTRILRSATAMYNACKKSYEENNCKGCPFDVGHGCSLYDHPISWEDKLKFAKNR